jgi:TonB family protein
MRRLGMVGMVVLLLTPWRWALATDSPSGEELLAAADRLVHIRGTSPYAFQMEGDFRAQINIPEDGHFTLRWASGGLWSLSITMGQFQEFQVKKGEYFYTHRNLAFTPLPLTELLGFLDVFDADPKDWKVRKVRRRSEDGAERQCVEMQPVSKGSKPQICLDPTTSRVTWVETKEDDDYERDEFSEYRPFHEHQYPARLKRYKNGSLELSIQVVSLVDGVFDQASFVAPPGSIVRRQCANLTHPVPVRTPDPQYPKGAAQNGIMRTSAVSLTVLPDGSVADIHLVGSAEHEMDAATLATIKTWKFRPAMCGNEPVAYDIHVIVDFRLSQ